jgi:hypothetical protein
MDIDQIITFLRVAGIAKIVRVAAIAPDGRERSC